jgi:predicted tellurium resistance membrane protein TerC
MGGGAGSRAYHFGTGLDIFPPPFPTRMSSEVEFMEWISNPEAWVALATLTILEIVLGIDNVVFIAIVAGRLPEEEQGRAWKVGLSLAMLSRLALLFSIVWIMRLTQPLFTLLGHPFSGRDLILIGGGLFLLGKSTRELHHNLEGDKPGRDSEGRSWSRTFWGVLLQIVALDIIFSLDSVITAVGIADQVAVMAIAIVIAVGVMMLSAEGINSFIRRHPTIKMLALSFLLLIGMALVAEGLGQHIPKGYLYFAMGFSIFVEMLNLKAAKKPAEPVRLRGSLPGQSTEGGAA